MAVTTTVTSVIEYIRSGDNLGGCIGGGEDYRSVTKGTETDDLLLIRGWAGDNISSACKIVSVKIENLSTRIRNTSNGTAAVFDEYYCGPRLGTCTGSVSGTVFTSGSDKTLVNLATITKDNKSNYENIGGQTVDLNGYNKVAKDNYIGVGLKFATDISLSTTQRRIYVRDVMLTAVRTRACYANFYLGCYDEELDEWVSGNEHILITCDYGTVPSYGSTPVLEGYKFVGWRSLESGQVYTAALPTAYEQDVSYTAEWEKATYTVTATAGEGGTVSGGDTYEHGATATLKATPNTGYKFVKWSDGVTTATRTVTVTGEASYTAVFTPVIVTYDNIFNFFRWKEKGITSGRGTVSNVNDYLFDFTASVDDAYTGYSHMFKVESGQKYTFRYAVGGSGTSRESFVFFHDTEGDYSWTKLASSTASEWDFTVPDGYSWASIRFDVNTKGETITYGDVRIYPADCSYMGNTVPMSDRFDKAGWSMPTPTRSGYKFKGWNTKVDGSGKFYTASDAYPTDDLVLYSIWEADPPKFTDAQMLYNGKQISATNKVPVNQGFIIEVKLA